MLKRVFNHHIGRFVTFGRRTPTIVQPHYRLSRYMTTEPTPPASVSYAPAAGPALSDVYCNNTLGCCVIASGYHIEGVATGNAGNLFVASDAQIVTDYAHIGGYVPGNPATDNGCEIQTALAYWQAKGFANGTKLLGYISANATNKLELMLGMYLFENCDFGVALPDAYINPFPSGNGFVWDVAGATDPQNGHSFCGIGYGPSGARIDTWGLQGTFTWNAIAQYAILNSGGEVWFLLTPDIINKAMAKAPCGFNLNQLISDFDGLGGSVVVPPAPTPVPPPVPHPSITLAQAQQAASAGAMAGLKTIWPSS